MPHTSQTCINLRVGVPLAVLVLLLHLSALSLEASPMIVAFGDSITAGPGMQPEETYPAQLQALLRERTGDDTITVINAGVGGNTVTAGLSRLESEVLAHQPRAVLIGFGMNDSVMVATGKTRVPPQEFRRQLTQLVRRVQARGALALLATVTPVIEEYYFDRHPREWYPEGLPPVLQQYTAVIREVAAETGARVVDLSRLDPPRHLRTPQNSNLRDGVHPNAVGYHRIALIYARALCGLEGWRD